MVVVVGIVVEVGGLVEVVVAGGRVLVEDVVSGSVGGAGCSAEHPARPARSAVSTPAIAIVRGAAPVLIPVGRVVVDPPSNAPPISPASTQGTGVRPGRIDRLGKVQLSGTS